MVFSFFKKSKTTPSQELTLTQRTQRENKTKTEQLPRTASRSEQPPASVETKELGADAFDGSEFEDGPISDMEVVEVTSNVDAAIEEAAIYYANDHAEQAATTLINWLGEHHEEHKQQPWMMLFDLYQLIEDKRAYEEFAVKYSVQFERSAPPWEDAALVSPANPSKSVTIALSGTLNETNLSKLEQLPQLNHSGAVNSLDVSKVTAIEESGAASLLKTVSELKQKKIPLKMIGSSTLINLVKQKIEESEKPQSQAWWLLMLELYQAEGMQDEFENIAVDYAVLFEVSPPSWDNSMRYSEMPDSNKSSDVATEVSPNDYQLTGIINAENEQQLKNLKNFAIGKHEIRIDMSKVKRVDFMSVGTFINMLIEISQGEKDISIIGANEMVFALFKVMGVNQFATLVGKKPH